MMQNLERESWYVGNLVGVPIFLHWTAALMVLLAWNMSGGSGVEGFLLVLISLIAAIVLHELGHGLTARALGAFGITITLWAFGGLCKSTRDPARVGREIAIVAAGPAVSLLLWLGSGWTFDALATHAPDLMRSGDRLSLLALFLRFFEFLNLLLLLFNILPIFPLDGGQLTFHGLRLVLRDVMLAAKISLFLAVMGALAYFCWATGLFSVIQQPNPFAAWMARIGNNPGSAVWTAILLGILLRNAFMYLR